MVELLHLPEVVLNPLAIYLWAKAARLLSEPEFFDLERERVLADYPLLNSHGLGQVRRRRRIWGRWEMEHIPDDLNAARDELRAGGKYEGGLRNTLEYFVEGRVSLSYPSNPLCIVSPV